jgi:hypothetical protein
MSVSRKNVTGRHCILTLEGLDSNFYFWLALLASFCYIKHFFFYFELIVIVRVMLA